MASPERETPAPPQTPGAGRRTRAPGDRSRARVLEHAVALATLEGLDGVSIARLAAATGMPKSSVYVLFGSKQELQLATIDAARASFIRHVVTPAITTTPSGRQRLQRLCDGYLDYVEQRIFPGGCFFVTASAEMGGLARAGTRPRRPLPAAVAPAPVGDDPPGTHRSPAPSWHRPRPARIRTRRNPRRIEHRSHPA